MANNDIITDVSYTNKDFQTIYSELLDLVKKLTNKWDPSLSNESDPGVLLLKLNAIIADKNNYNIDKNILECFPASVTQEGNARHLYDLLGYRMSWYKSAIFDIGFRLLKNDVTDTFTLKCFDTSIIDNGGEVVYTLLQDVTINSDESDVVTVKAIEGSVQNYIINGSVNEEGISIIGLTNLDNDLRLYFPETTIAENGIFIKNAGDPLWDIDPSSATFAGWKLVDNLASYPAGNKVYEFGVLPNSNTCYIQFPKDISTLIGSGLQIKYTLTNGQNGNIKANTLNAFYADQVDENTGTVINDYIKIIQTNAVTNGADPETISEAYNNYKKLVGTFNTLITKKDYENYLYNYTQLDKNICSNCFVTDRTNSINDSNYIQTWNGFKDTKVLQIDQISNTYDAYTADGTNATITLNEDSLNAYNIIIHLLNPQSSIYDKNTYNNTFIPNKDMHISELESILSEVKSCNHDIILGNNTRYASDVFNYLNLYTLKGQLITYYKVTKAEASEIEANVMQALFKNYNARNVNFGEEIDYNDLIDVITNSDPRIKSIVLTNNTCKTVQQILNGTLVELDNDLKSELLAKMVLNGTAQLFTFDSNFNYDFGQQEVTQISHKDTTTDKYSTNIYSISSEANITIPKANLEEQDTNTASYLKENEILQIYAPNLVVTKEYSTYVKYYLETVNIEGSIPANTDYQLQPGEYLNLSYTDTSDITQEVTLTNPTIIYSNIELQRNTIADWTLNHDKNWSQDSNKYDYLYTGKYIQTKEISQSNLPYKTKYYFKLNNPTNTLVINELQKDGTIKEKPYILQENEYFLYTNTSSTQTVLLGSGTKLSLSDKFVLNQTLPNIDIDTIDVNSLEWLELGVGGISGTDSNVNAVLTTTDLKIITLGQGTYFATEGTSVIATNEAQELPTPFKYATKLGIANDIQEVIDYPLADIKWQVQSRLNITTSLEKAQKLESNHTITLSFDKNNTQTETITSQGDLYVNFNYPVVISGGNNIDVQVLNYYGELNYSLNCYTYKLNDQYTNDSNYSRSNGLLTLNGTGHISNTLPFTFTLDDSDIANLPEWARTGSTPLYNIPAWILPIYVKTHDDSTISISYVVNNADKDATLYDPIKSNVKSNKEFQSTNGKFYCLLITPNTTAVKIAFSGSALDEQTYVTLGSITKIKGINISELECTDTNGYYNLLDLSRIQNTVTTVADGEAGTNGSVTYLELQNFDNIIRHMKLIDINSLFNWAYKGNTSDIVLEPTNPVSFWNINHVYNSYVLPKIDFDTYNITVNNSNIKV